jgi:hypothetical protein
MAEPVIEKKKEETEEMDITPTVEENVPEEPVSENADEILANQEAESPTIQEESKPEPMEVSFPASSKKTRRAKCPPGCMRKPKCSSTGGKRSKKSKKTKKGGKKSRKSRKSRK